MSKTVDELCDVFGQASGAEYERWLYDQRNDHVALAAGPALAMRRAGIAAVVRVLRDEIFDARGNASYGSLAIYDLFNEILGEAGEKVGEAPDLPTRTVQLTGITKSARPDVQFEPATDPAPAVCVWRDIPMTSEYLAKCGWRQSNIDHRTNCPSCGKPIRYVEAK